MTGVSIFKNILKVARCSISTTLAWAFVYWNALQPSCSFVLCAAICSPATLSIHELCVPVQNSPRWIFPTTCPLMWTAKRNDSSSVHSTWTMLCWKVQLSLICVFIVMFYGAVVDKKVNNQKRQKPCHIYIFLTFVFRFNKAYIR